MSVDSSAAKEDSHLDIKTRRRDARGRFLGEGRANREAVKIDYEANVLTTNEVAIKHSISASSLHRMVVQNGWTPRAPHRIDPNDLVMRMFSALDTQLRDLETTTMDGNNSQAGMLARLVTTLDRLIEIKEVERRKRRSDGQASKEVTELRAKIAERIAELNAA